MIVEAALQAWLADRPAQRRSRSRADAAAAEWNDGAVHHRMAETFSGLSAATAEIVAEAAAGLFADDDWVDTLVATMAARLVADPFFEPPFRHISSDIHRGLVVFEDGVVSIGAGLVDIQQLAAKKRAPSGPGAIIFSGRVELFKFIKAGGAMLSLWSAPPITAGFTAATAGRCERTSDRPAADGEILHVDGRRESFIIEHADANLLVVQATIKQGCAPVAVHYDAGTREYAGCSAADDSASRIQMITTLLRKLDCEAAFPAIAEFLHHPSFFVRWHVMRELLGIDVGAALPHLKRMAARDPHPETRRTAGTVLDRIEAGPDEQREAA